jgi:hypothetical protein
MRNKLLIVGLMALTVPGMAMAQPYDPGCVQSNRDNRAAGTVLGAVGGALLGSAVAGRHSRGAGAIVGGIGGAAVGNAVAGSSDHPCPSGYYYAPPPPRGGGGEGFWRGAPAGISQRIDFMQDRINRAAERGWISPEEARHANFDLNDVRRQRDRLRYQDGGHLRPVDRDYLQSRLDNISQRLHWAEHNG